ncbi:chemotaxis protein CheW [Geoanaerobacter pelophilus]|uniref:Chemotaxis protein CheW n=1 Tax=Geoanaerobacter pelophilus TaxID=60036 RepID=A0ABQ0ML17_9BACT|nr:chemotaxis protein CheW [Geoanaerobacter pelophilus]GAW67778.1 chemotaxis protein CheW [Geoanaerobacter pelophilus]
MAPSKETLNSELILNELKHRQRSKEIVDVEEERVKVVVFTCCGNRYAFYGEDVREFIPNCEISWVPGLPDYLPGLINVRGDIESVIDITPFLGEGKKEAFRGLVAMAVREDFRSGVMIDSIEDVVDVPAGSIKPPLSTLSGAARELVAGELEYEGALVPLLDLGKLGAKITL